MKHLIKFLLVGICILLIATPSSPAKDSPVKSAAYKTSPSSVFDITYAVFVWTPVSTLFRPRYVDQFEFKAGDVFSAYTTRYGELTGTWIESDIVNGTWFQAWVEKEETSTTTTTPTETTTTIPSGQSTGMSRLIEAKGNELKYDIHIWGISFNYTPPAPLDNFTFSTILGYGNYLGADALFMGFANFPTEITCGSVSPAEAEQGDTLTITIGCKNANFMSATTISVSMQQGSTNDITVSNPPSRLDDNQITVSITIDGGAEISDRTVTVIVDDVAISAETKFKVKENTN